MSGDDVLPEWVPRHPTLPGHRAPLMGHWLADEDPRWGAGPWKTTRATAVKAGWTVRSVVARGYTHGPATPSDGLVDTMSLRCQRGVQRAVAVWERRTWPVLGRGRKDDDGRVGEGRTSTAGKTWLWHPPMALSSAEGVDVVKFDRGPSWTFAAGWAWTMGGPVRVVSSSDLRAWLKGVPGT